jgi:hypothetical protein
LAYARPSAFQVNAARLTAAITGQIPLVWLKLLA